MVDGVPVSISSCVRCAVLSSAPLLLFCHLMEKQRPVGRPAQSSGSVSGHGIRDLLLMSPLEGGGGEK